jgi:hypothetical protein
MTTETVQNALLAAALSFACVAVHGQSTEMQITTPIVATIDVQQTAPPGLEVRVRHVHRAYSLAHLP